MQHGLVLLRVQVCSLQLKARALFQITEVIFDAAVDLNALRLCCRQECRAAKCSLQAEAWKGPGCSRAAVVLKDGGRNVPARACDSHESENAGVSYVRVYVLCSPEKAPHVTCHTWPPHALNPARPRLGKSFSLNSYCSSIDQKEDNSYEDPFGGASK